jgi:hypothetical protein
MNRHANLQAAWASGQVWETRVPGCETWVPVGDAGHAPPLWDEHQEYRRRPDLEQLDTVTPELTTILNRVRALREQHAPVYDELRQAFNAAADRLDALVSTLRLVRAAGGQRYQPEKGGDCAVGPTLRTDVSAEGRDSVTNAPGDSEAARAGP